MAKMFTVAVETPVEAIEAAIVALRNAQIPARRDRLADNDRIVVSAGFPHEGPPPTSDLIGEWTGRVLDILTSAAIQAKAVGVGFATEQAFTQP